MYAFARRPRWIMWHVLVLLAVVVMVNLGFWQLRRLHERQDRNDAIRARSAAAVVPVGELLPPGGDVDTASLQWRKVALAGTYRPGDQMLVANRIVDGEPGYWVVTPLTLDDGASIAVVRGFVYRQQVEGFGTTNLVPPSGRVEVEGVLQRSVKGGRIGEEGTRDGPVTAITQLDLRALGERWGALEPMWVRQTSGPGGPGTVEGNIQPVPEPELGDGPHLSYAFQWFIFATIAVVGYPLVLRRVAHGEERQRLGLDALDPDDIPWAPGLGPAGPTTGGAGQGGTTGAFGSPEGASPGHPGVSGAASSNGVDPAGGRDRPSDPGARRS